MFWTSLNTDTDDDGAYIPPGSPRDMCDEVYYKMLEVENKYQCYRAQGLNPPMWNKNEFKDKHLIYVELELRRWFIAFEKWEQQLSNVRKSTKPIVYGEHSTVDNILSINVQNDQDILSRFKIKARTFIDNENKFIVKVNKDYWTSPPKFVFEFISEVVLKKYINSDTCSISFPDGNKIKLTISIYDETYDSISSVIDKSEIILFISLLLKDGL